MYTETGYDASRTLPRRLGRGDRRRPGCLAVGLLLGDHGGSILLLSFLFAANDVAAIDDGAGYSTFIFTSALDSWAAKLVILIATVGQLFCGAAGLTSASRTWYAFSRDRAIPGWTLFRRVNRDRVPFNAVIAVSVFSLIVAIPALFGKNDVPFAFYALTGICTVGLYIAYIIPVYLRLRAGDNFKPGPWTLEAKYRWVNSIGIFFVILVVFALQPAVHAGGPAVERRFRLEPRQLHAAGGLVAPGLRGLVPGLREEQVPGAGEHARGGRGHQGLRPGRHQGSARPPAPNRRGAKAAERSRD